METIRMAELFVILIKKYDWDKIKIIPENEVKILFEIVSAAGFEIGSIRQGEASFWSYGDKGKYIINKFCPYKVLTPKGEGHACATKWLDCIFSFLVQGDINTKKKIEVIRKEIERSRVPLEPICLTTDGDTLKEGRDLSSPFIDDYVLRKPPYGDLKEHLEDEDELRDNIGVHDCCGGLMKRRQTTPSNSVMLCGVCNLRITFPTSVETYGGLRLFLQTKLGVKS